MSLVLTWFSPEFIGIVCDGRSSLRDEVGNLEPFREDRHKVHYLSSEIAIASTSYHTIGSSLSSLAKEFADARQDDPGLFEALRGFVPRALLALHADAKILGKTEGMAVMLLGYDALQQRMRLLTFIAAGKGENCLEFFEESASSVCAIGNPDAAALAGEICGELPSPTVDCVLPLLEYVAISVADRVPWSINKNLRSGLILRPGAPGVPSASKSVFPGFEMASSVPERGDELAAELADGATFKRLLHIHADNTLHASTALLNQGSVAQVSANTFSYTSTTTSITWSWTAFTVYAPDGSTVAVAAGSQTFSSLASSTTYYFGIYVTLAGATAHVVLSDVSSGVARESLAQIVQIVNGDGNVPVTANVAATTTASGTGGGGGGAPTCFSPNTKVQTRRGNVSFSELRAGDFVLTARGTWREVVFVTCLDYEGPMLDMGGGELVTPTHLFLSGNKWLPVEELNLFERTHYKGTIHNAHLETEKGDEGHAPDTEHSYTLSNGHLAHNFITY
jgi:hypothetical protein